MKMFDQNKSSIHVGSCCLVCVTVGKSQKVVKMLKTKKSHCCTYKIA